MSSCNSCDDRRDYLGEPIPPPKFGACIVWILIFFIALAVLGVMSRAKGEDRTVYRDRHGNLIGTEIKSGRTAYFRDRYGRIAGSSKEWAGTTYYYDKTARMPIASKTGSKPLTKLEYYKPQTRKTK